MLARGSFFLISLLVLCMLALSGRCWSASGKNSDEKKQDAEADTPKGDDAPGTSDEQTIEIVASPVDADGVSVVRMDRQEMDSLGAQSVDQVLEMFAGISVDSGRKGQRSVSLRGFDQRQVDVLLDGVPLSLPYDGPIDLSLIPSELLQGLSVLKGAGSVLFGPNGMGGAINLRTRDPASMPLLGVRLQAGQFDSVSASAYHAKSYGPVDVLVMAGLRQASAFGLSSSFSPTKNEDGGERENSSFDMMHTLAKLRWHVGVHHDLHAGLVFVDGQKAVEPDVFEDKAMVRYWDFDPWRSLSVSLGHSGRYANSWRSDEVVYFNIYDNTLLSYDDATYSTQKLPKSFSSRYLDRAMGIRLRANGLALERDWASVLSRSWLGVEYDTHSHSQDSDVDDALGRFWVSAAQELKILIGERWSFSAGLQWDLELGPSVQDQDSLLDWALLPMASARLQASSFLALEASAARRARFPTLKERYSSDGVFRLPNPDLGAESAWHFGLDFIAGPWRGLKASLGLFDAEVEDLIQNVPVATPTRTAEQLVNIGRSRLAGAEVKLVYAPWDELRLSASYAWLYARRLYSEPGEDLLEYRPSHKLLFQVHGYLFDRLHLWSGLRLQGPSDFVNPNTLAWGRLGVFVVWDAKLEFDLSGSASVWLMMTNLLDSDYQTQYGYPEPGRTVWIGLRFSYLGADKKRPRE